MADFIPVPDCAHVTLEYMYLGIKGFTNGLDFKKGTPYAVEDLNAIVEGVQDAWDESVNGLFTSEISFIGCNARALDAEDAPSVLFTFPTASSGVRSGGIPALHTAMSVTLRTGLAGRSFRGRLFHAGLATVDLANKTTWETSAAAAVSAGYNTFISALETLSGGQNVVISRQQGGVTLAEGEATPTTQYVGRLPVATVRGRVRS